MADSKISALPASTVPLVGTEVLPIVQSGATKQVTVANLTAGRSVATGALTSSGLITGSVGGAFQGNTTPAAGAGVEVRYTTQGIILAYDRTGGAYKPMQYDGLSHTFITSSGGTLFNITSSATTFTTNNLVQGTAAKGINFTANTPAAGMTSQLLNWYEEGTWTPAFDGGVTTYGTCTGTYTRVGRLVTATFVINVTTASGIGGVALNITGLPFANIQNFAAASFSVFTNIPYSAIFGLCASGSTTIQMRGSNSAATAPALINQASLLNGTLMAGSITYQTS